MFALGLDQLAAAQKLQGHLHSAFGKASGFGEVAQTCGNGFPARAHGLAVEIKINQISGGLTIVTDDVAQQNIDNVVVDRNGFPKSGHGDERRK